MIGGGACGTVAAIELCEERTGLIDALTGTIEMVEVVESECSAESSARRWVYVGGPAQLASMISR